MNSDQTPLQDREHVLKGLPRLRFRRPEQSLAEVRTGVHRWWWEFLRLSKDYWLVCQTSHPGRIATEDERLRRVYRRFGDVHTGRFEDWWLERGYRLFSEQERFPKVSLVPSKLQDRTRQAPPPDRIWVEVPLKLSRRTIQKQIGQLLDGYQDERPRSRLELSTAEFRINPVQFGTHTLQKTHDTYTLHRELIEKVKWQKLHQPDQSIALARADLFRIGKLLNISPSNSILRGEPQVVRARLNRMRVSVSRILKRAELLISNVEQGLFPSYKPLDPAERRFTQRQLDQHKELESKWWEVNLISELSMDKMSAVRSILYDEPERTRQNDLALDPAKRRVIIRDA